MEKLIIVFVFGHQAYSDIEDKMVKGLLGTIVQGYLKKGDNRATMEMMTKKFFRYES